MIFSTHAINKTDVLNVMAISSKEGKIKMVLSRCYAGVRHYAHYHTTIDFEMVVDMQGQTSHKDLPSIWK